MDPPPLLLLLLILFVYGYNRSYAARPLHYCYVPFSLPSEVCLLSFASIRLSRIERIVSG
jgi:hypothetical protein